MLFLSTSVLSVRLSEAGMRSGYTGTGWLTVSSVMKNSCRIIGYPHRGHTKKHPISITADYGIFFKTKLTVAGSGHPANAQMASTLIRTCRTLGYPASARGEREKSTGAGTRRFLTNAASRSTQRQSFRKAAEGVV